MRKQDLLPVLTLLWLLGVGAAIVESLIAFQAVIDVPAQNAHHSIQRPPLRYALNIIREALGADVNVSQRRSPWAVGERGQYSIA